MATSARNTKHLPSGSYHHSRITALDSSVPDSDRGRKRCHQTAEYYSRSDVSSTDVEQDYAVLSAGRSVLDGRPNIWQNPFERQTSSTSDVSGRHTKTLNRDNEQVRFSVENNLGHNLLSSGGVLVHGSIGSISRNCRNNSYQLNSNNQVGVSLNFHSVTHSSTTRRSDQPVACSIQDNNSGIEQMDSNFSCKRGGNEVGQTLSGQAAPGHRGECSLSDEDVSHLQHGVDERKLGRKKLVEGHNLVSSEQFISRGVGMSNNTQTSYYDRNDEATSRQSNYRDDCYGHRVLTSVPKPSPDELRHQTSALVSNVLLDRKQDEPNGSQIAAHLIQIQDWSQRITSRIEQLDENADPECKKLKDKLLSLLDDFKRSESDCSNLLRKVLAQREKELLMRHNVVESSFHCEDYRTDDETELGLCSDGESVHTLDDRRAVSSVSIDRCQDSPLNNRRPRIESHLGHHPDSDVDLDDHNGESATKEASNMMSCTGTHKDFSALLSSRSVLEAELLERSQQLVDLREQHAHLQHSMERQLQLQAQQKRQMAVLISAGAQQKVDEDDGVSLLANAFSDGHALASRVSRGDESTRDEKKSRGDDQSTYTLGAATSSSANINLVQLSSGTRIDANARRVGGCPESQHSRQFSNNQRIIGTTHSSHLENSEGAVLKPGGAALGPRAAVPGHQPRSAAEAFCSVALSDSIVQAPNDLGGELSKKEIELLLLHQRQTEQRLRMLEEQHGVRQLSGTTVSSGSNLVLGRDSSFFHQRQTPATSESVEGERTDGSDANEQALNALLQLNPDMRDKMSRLAAASDRLKKLHELVSMAHQQSSAFTETSDSRPKDPSVRLETNRAMVTLQSRATSEIPRGVMPTAGNTDSSPIALDDLSKEQHSNSPRQDHQVQRIQALEAKRDQLLAMEDTLQQLIDSMQTQCSIESSTHHRVLSDTLSQKPAQLVRTANNTPFSRRRFTDDAHSSAFDESGSCSESVSTQPTRRSIARPATDTSSALHCRGSNDASLTSSHLLRIEQNRSTVNDAQSCQPQRGTLLPERDPDNRLIQNNQRQFSREEPRRLNNQPMEGVAGIHVLHNVTSTSKNVHRRRSPDMTSYEAVGSEMQALRSDVQSLTTVVQSARSDQSSRDSAIVCHQHSLLVNLERSFRELLSNNVALCERMKRLEQMIYFNNASSAFSVGSAVSTPNQRDPRQPLVYNDRESFHIQLLSDSRSGVDVDSSVIRQFGTYKSAVNSASSRSFQQSPGTGPEALSGWQSKDIHGNDERRRSVEEARSASRSTGNRRGKSSRRDDYSGHVPRANSARTGTLSTRVDYSSPISRPSGVASHKSSLRTGSELLTDSRWNAEAYDGNRDRNSPSSCSGVECTTKLARDNVPTTSFEALKELIYSEVAALISQNEARPRYLIELFRRLQQLTTDGQRDMAVTSFERIVSDYLTENDLDLERSSKGAPNRNNNSSHVASDWQSVLRRRFHDVASSSVEGEVSVKTERKGLTVTNSSEGIYSPDPDHDNDMSRSSEPEEVEEQLEASTDSDMDALAEKLGFVSVNFTNAASPPSYSCDSWEKSADEKSADEEVSDSSQQPSVDNIATPHNTSSEQKSDAPEQEKVESRDAKQSSTIENDVVVKSVLSAFSEEEIAERMASEFQGEDIVHGILNELDGVNVSELSSHPFYLKPPDSS